MIASLNYLNPLTEDPYKIYSTCDFSSINIDTSPGTPNYVHTFKTSDAGHYHYFVCGRPGHCKDGHVRAVVQVVNNRTECDHHSYY